MIKWKQDFSARLSDLSIEEVLRLIVRSLTVWLLPMPLTITDSETFEGRAGIETKDGLTLGNTVVDYRYHHVWEDLPKVKIARTRSSEIFKYAHGAGSGIRSGRNKMFQKEKIYIAGPECFYTGGYDMLAAMRAESIAKGLE